MPSDDYAAIGGGALRLKGAKVQKKKKKKRSKTDLEKNISKGDDNADARGIDDHGDDGPKKAVAEQGEPEDDEAPAVPKTESERRYEEVKKKRVSPDLHRLRRHYAVDTTAAPPDDAGFRHEIGAAENPQGACRGAQYVSFQVERASRHAQDRPRLA